MALLIHHDKVTNEVADALAALCPFHAFEYADGNLSINAGCKLCKLCVKNGPAGAITWEEETAKPTVDKTAWRGIAVYIQAHRGALHPVGLELLGKAKQLAKVSGEEVYALLAGYQLAELAQELRHYGPDKIFVCDDERLARWEMPAHAGALEHCIQACHPGSVMVGATYWGRSLAPRVAARLKTGLTADCTMLEMRENTDLVQIRPAFGGNIMAQIVTQHTRPQFCTVRYKIFDAPARSGAPAGEVVPLPLPAGLPGEGKIREIAYAKKAAACDISNADIIVAVGRGVSSKADLALLEGFVQALGAEWACTRPLIENGWFDPRRQIGLSGRTVKAKLIVTVGVSGSVQFVAGMAGCEKIIAINTDENAPIFGVAHHGLVGDWREILPVLLAAITEGESDGVQTLGAG